MYDAFNNTFNKAFNIAYPWSNASRVYLSRKEKSKGLLSVTDTALLPMVGQEKYVV